MNLYVIPPQSRRTGVRSWALRQHSLLPNEGMNYRVVDADRLELQNADGFLHVVHIGLNEAACYSALVQMLDAGLQCVVVVHDPPQLAHSKRAWMEKLSGTRVGRGARWIINRWFSDIFDAGIISRVHSWVCLSECACQALQERLSHLGSSAAIIHKVPHGLYPDISIYKKESNIPLLIGMFGHLSPGKGYDHLINGFLAAGEPVQHGIRLVVAGEPDSASAARHLAALSKRVSEQPQKGIEFLPGPSDVELPTFLDSLSVLAIPYKNLDSVSASGPMAWAWTRGLPVASTPTRYAKEYLIDGGGWILRDASVDAWKEFFTSLNRDAVYLRAEEVERHRQRHSDEYCRASWISILQIPNNF